MRGLLDERAALVVVSAPSYPHGVLDPVGEIAALAASAGVACHVDACIGGWILPFLDDVPEPFDLAVPGVTSLSVDLHKYAYAPKGVSVLLTAEPELRQNHWFSTAGWPGYPVVNPTLAGTRPAGPMAAAWAVHRLLGTEGKFGEAFGLTDDWAYRIIKLVGNYGEVFERNVGQGSPLKIARGLNGLWTKGGLQFAPPVR